MSKKLKLDQINIESFQTSQNKIKGGTGTYFECPIEIIQPPHDPFFTMDMLCQRISIGPFCFPNHQK